MSDIQNIKLELLREGPAHNQLLSPLTPYLALCGDNGPATVHMPFEHRQLVSRLQRLRYAADDGAVAESQRRAELRDMGELIGDILSKVPSLLSELSNAQNGGGKLVHLRLSLSAFELGMLPFEAAIAPEGFPGSGSPLFLQPRVPITITREIRRGRPLPLDWNRKPRILFAFASPDGLPEVPAQSHLEALRSAIDPWVKIKDDAEERIKEVKSLLTVLPGASIEKIRKACLDEEYTHVHILAHGDRFGRAEDSHFGIALCSDSDPSQRDVIDGDRLSAALMARDYNGTVRKRPSVVTLSTCDSGNANSVMTPGGSMAHQLHAAGIPWVIASQFPLWFRASTIATEVLYEGLLSGADPRCVMHALRQRLLTDSPNTHDWASFVAYTTVPWDFEAQVVSFHENQFRRKMEVLFDRFDHLVGASGGTQGGEGAQGSAPDSKELHALCARIRTALAAWCEEPISAKQKAERMNMRAASEKRIALGYALIGEAKTSREAYGKSRDFYREAIKAEPANDWALTQYLSIVATPVLAPTGESLALIAEQFGSWWSAARQIAEWKKQQASGQDLAWALATLAELELLGAVYGGASFERGKAQEKIEACCKTMRDLDLANRFPLRSTQRQFARYAEHWKRPEWAGLAAAALKVFTRTP